jgi:hypothetical protein
MSTEAAPLRSIGGVDAELLGINPFSVETQSLHIAPAHFGAAIESLQNPYIKAHPSAVPEGWAPREVWAALSSNPSAQR